jgi:drug/metabolite transporter (DMT)-like permease
MLLTFQPLASVLLAIVLLGEDPTAPQLVGAGCIVAGLLFLAVRSRRP